MKKWILFRHFVKREMWTLIAKSATVRSSLTAADVSKAVECETRGALQYTR